MATNNFSDWSKMFGDFKASSVDFNQLIAQYRRNAEASSAILQILTESAQANARRMSEVARANAELMLKASKEAFNHSTPESAAAKQADFSKNLLEFNVNSLREIAETSTKSTREVFDVITKRVAEGVKEFSDTATHTSKKKAA